MRLMIRISITSAAFEATASTLPLGSAGYENELVDKIKRKSPNGVNHFNGLPQSPRS